MTKRTECNSALTENTFTKSDKYRRARGAVTLCDMSGKILGSVSRGGIFDLYGKRIAAFKSGTYRRVGARRIRVTDYESAGRVFRLEGDFFYLVGKDGSDTLLGRLVCRRRNPFKIFLLGVMAVILALSIIILAPIGLPNNELIKPIVDIKDNNGAWTAQENVAMFDETIKPGSSGEYAFIISNGHDIELDYSFYVEPRYVGSSADMRVARFPIKFRMYMNNIPIIDDWRNVDGLRFDNAFILPNTKQQFVIEWSWPFEGGADVNDTLIGEGGGSIFLVLHLSAEAR